MMYDILYYTHTTLLLIFGIILSTAFAGIRLSRRTVIFMSVMFVLCGLLQLSTYFGLDENATWKLYPLITHLPLALFTALFFKKRIVTTVAAVTTAYLCCQPAKWFGLLVYNLTESGIANEITQIIILIIVGLIITIYLAPAIAEIYNKETRSILIFSSIPAVYYAFDYMMGIYTNLLAENNRLATEFLPFILCFAFMSLCALYYKEYEQKADAERKEHLIRIAIEQQSKEIDTIRSQSLQTKILRHDMRHLMENLALSIKNDDKESALTMIRGYTQQIESASLQRFCSNDTINYILSHFKSKCDEQATEFRTMIDTDFFSVDETSFASITSNILENALNAQNDLPPDGRFIEISISSYNNRLLLSCQNPFKTAPVFVNGMPVSQKPGHGYGTQSIVLLTEKMGGKCQFLVQDNLFITRVII